MFLHIFFSITYGNVSLFLDSLKYVVNCFENVNSNDLSKYVLGS